MTDNTKINDFVIRFAYVNGTDSAAANALLEGYLMEEEYGEITGIGGVVFETAFTYFERGNQIAIQMLEELSHEKSYSA